MASSPHRFIEKLFSKKSTDLVRVAPPAVIPGAIWDQMPFGVILYPSDSDSPFFSNETARNLMNLEPGEEPWSLGAFSPPGFQVGTWEVDLQTDDVEPLPIECTLRVFLQQTSESYRALFLRSIALRRRREEQLNEIEERYLAVVNSVSQSIVQVDQEARITFFNPSWRRLVVSNGGPVLNRPLVDFFHDANREALLDWIEKRLSGDQTDEGLFVRLKPVENEEVWMFLLGSCIFRQRTVPGFIVTMIDVTQEKKTREALEQAKRLAEEASQAKGAFLATLSHEIRTPMNAILGMSQLLLEASPSEDQREFATSILESGEVLLSLINRVLDHSRIEAGELRLENEPFCLYTPLSQALTLSAHAAARKGIDLVYRIDPGVPLYLKGDELRLRQVLINLVSNAVKFTDKGFVRLEVSRIESLEGAGSLHFSLTDTGAGIPEKTIPLLFAPFKQADSSISRRHGGSGLGLAISKGLVDLMGGSMKVVSEVGRGSTFSFTIPLQLASEDMCGEASGQDPRSYSFQGKGCLLISLNSVERDSLAFALNSIGFSVTSVGAMDEAVDRLLREKQKINVIVLQSLPGEKFPNHLFRRFDQYPDLARLPVLLLHRIGQRLLLEPTNRPLAQLATPVYPHSLGAALTPLLASSDALPNTKKVNSSLSPIPDKSVAPLESQGQSSTPPALSVILAEDNPINQKLGVMILRRMGLEPRLASDGQEVLNLLQKQSCDLILMDVQMPVIDGILATKKIRAMEGDIKNQPVIIALTANAMEGDSEACLAAGMDAYLAKPIRLDKLESVIAGFFPDRFKIMLSQQPPASS
jgi:PAS domain S-box-containing protein